MSLAPYLPPASGDADAALTLLRTVSDPAAAKKAIERMVEERKAIEAATQKQLEALARAQAAVKAAKEDNEKLKAEADAMATKSAIDLGAAKTERAHIESRKEEIEAAERRMVAARVALDEREQKLQRWEEDLKGAALALKDREDQIIEHSRRVAQREDALAMREKTLAEDIAENTKWLASLKPPRGR